MLNFEQIAANVAVPSDGVVGFYDGTNHYLAWGWTAGSATLADFWRSTDGAPPFLLFQICPTPRTHWLQQ